MKKGYSKVPATARQVRRFVEESRSKYENDLRMIRGLVDRLRVAEPGMRSVYKIYSRGELQGLDELKAARKIRLKFNEFNQKSRVSEASLYDVPDIVGLTIVVPYPSGISAVAAVLDDSIDRGELVAVAKGAGDANTGIASRHGRPLGSRGYFACHYNVQWPGPGKQRPICEIQIKTLLHDAWGAKTHDLTYKPAGRIGDELLTSFDLLGDNLANLDRQSDALRTSIVLTTGVRERKRRAVQLAVLSNVAMAAVDAVDDAGVHAQLETIRIGVLGMSVDTPESVSRSIANELSELFNEESGAGSATSTLLCLLAAVTRRQYHLDAALEALEIREDAAPAGSVERLMVNLDAMLTPFAAGDVAEAVDAGEETLAEIDAMDEPVDAAIAGVRLTVVSNLAYFHADLIGSHEGDKRGSMEHARRYMDQARAGYMAQGYPARGLDSPDPEIVAAVGDADDAQASRMFFVLDSEAYVGIQCAKAEDELRAIRVRLEFLHRYPPASVKALALLAVDYHDYCARVRLSELERAVGR